MKTVKVNISELSGAGLDWCVAKCDISSCWILDLESFVPNHSLGRMNYSINWTLGGPIIEREHINLRPTLTDGGYRTSHSMDAVNAKIDLPNGSTVFDPLKVVQEYGPTPLIAAMRCYVASKLGEVVEVPAELLK